MPRFTRRLVREMSNGRWERRVGIWPREFGFGFAVLEGTDRLLDFGTKYMPRGYVNDDVVARVGELLAEYAPAHLVLEDVNASGCRRRPRVRDLLLHLARYAHPGCLVAVASEAEVRKHILGRTGGNKHNIADALTARFPEIECRLPRKRRKWAKEAECMAMFDAVALVVTSKIRPPPE